MRKQLLIALWLPLSVAAFQQGDVVAFLGGTDVVAAQFTGHLESRLAADYRDVRFRNLGWEGDTVFAQARQFGFPTMEQVLRRAGTTVVVLQFGRAEALDGTNRLEAFAAGYKKLLNVCTGVTSRLILVTPFPFESGRGYVPDLSRKNPDLTAFAAKVREIAQARQLPVIDLLHELRHSEGLTKDGLQLTAFGNALAANAFLRQLGRPDVEIGADGSWKDAKLERIRQVVIAKNRLWFDYSRPQNWAFLGGDRISQPSSHDHTNPKVRWFPAEMEKFVPLIAEKEREIEHLARGGTL